MADASRADAIQKLADLIRGVPVAMLTTTSPRGWLRSRPMVVQQTPFDGDLWFFTSGTAAKAADIRDRRQVNVSFASPERECYVSLSGMAALVGDRERMKQLWDSSYVPWFPAGLADPDLLLIRVQAEEAQYWDSTARTMVHVEGLLDLRPGFGDLAPGTGI
jgi:general stress protein 26